MVKRLENKKWVFSLAHCWMKIHDLRYTSLNLTFGLLMGNGLWQVLRDGW